MNQGIKQLFEKYKEFFVLPFSNHTRYLTEVINCDPGMKSLENQFEDAIVTSLFEPSRTRGHANEDKSKSEPKLVKASSKDDKEEAAKNNTTPSQPKRHQQGSHLLVYRSVAYQESYPVWMAKQSKSNEIIEKFKAQYCAAMLSFRDGDSKPLENLLQSNPDIVDFLEKKLHPLEEAAERWYKQQSQAANQALLDTLTQSDLLSNKPIIRNFMLRSLEQLNMDTSVSNDYFKVQFEIVKENLLHLSRISEYLTEIISKEMHKGSNNVLKPNCIDQDEWLSELLAELKTPLNDKNYARRLNETIYNLVTKKLQEISTSYQKIPPKPQKKKVFRLFTKPDYVIVLKEVIPDKKQRNQVKKILEKKSQPALQLIIQYYTAEYKANKINAEEMRKLFLACLDDNMIGAFKAIMPPIQATDSQETKIKKIYLENTIAELEHQQKNTFANKKSKKTKNPI